jgi:hypothetical protein
LDKIQEKVATSGGDIWIGSRKMLCLWPWPPVIFGIPRALFCEDDYRCFTRILRPGDFVLSRSESFALSNYMIGRHGTAFIHLAVYTGAVHGRKDLRTGEIIKPQSLGMDYEHTGRPAYGVHERTFTHAVSEGVICEDVLRLFSHIDYAAVIRPWTTAAQRDVIVKTALARVGQPYNFDFTPKGPESSYCTELGYFCCNRAGITQPRRSEVPVTLFGRLGKRAPVVLADSFVEQFGIRATSMSCSDRGFWSRSFLQDRMREAISTAADAGTFDLH